LKFFRVTLLLAVSALLLVSQVGVVAVGGVVVGRAMLALTGGHSMLSVGALSRAVRSKPPPIGPAFVATIDRLGFRVAA